MSKLVKPHSEGASTYPTAKAPPPLVPDDNDVTAVAHAGVKPVGNPVAPTAHLDAPHSADTDGDSVAGAAGDAQAAATPAAKAAKVASYFRGGATSIIHACREIYDGIKSYGDDQGQEFIAALGEVRVLPSDEVRFSLSGPTLSKYFKIGANADLLLRPELSGFQTRGYSPLYHTVVLHDVIPEKDPGAKLRALVGILASQNGPITRGFLESEIKKQKKKSAPADSNTTVEKDQGPTDEPSSDAIPKGETFDLVLVTPSREDIRMLGADYPDIDGLAQYLGLLDRVKEDAVVVVTARLRDRSAIEEKLLPALGFRRPSHVLLMRPPESPDIIDNDVLIVARRGKAKVTLPADGGWIDQDGYPTIPAIAASLHPDAESKLHIFARETSESWTCRIGDDTWANLPSVQ